MSKKQKLIIKFLNANHAYTWSDLVALLCALGFEPIEGNGSRVKFDNGNPEQVINLHKSHPQKEIKVYAIRQVREKLQSYGLI